MEHPVIAHIEKTLTDSYRKEIDQEENVWRTLPFFAAALGLQITTLSQLGMRALLPGVVGIATIALLVLSALLILVAIAFIVASVSPARFTYVAQETLLYEYAQGLIAAEQSAKSREEADPPDGITLLKMELSRQYAAAATHNRTINKRRERFRTFAGLTIMVSVVTTLLLVVLPLGHYIQAQFETGGDHAVHAAAR